MVLMLGQKVVFEVMIIRTLVKCGGPQGANGHETKPTWNCKVPLVYTILLPPG